MQRRPGVDEKRVRGGRKVRLARERGERTRTLLSPQHHGRNRELHGVVGKQLYDGVRHRGLVARGDAKHQAVVRVLNAAATLATPEHRLHRLRPLVCLRPRGSLAPGAPEPEQVQPKQRDRREWG